jgi:hypothetical protein
MARTTAGRDGRAAGGGTGFPICRVCGQGDLVPLSDYGGQGGAVQFKAWVCTEPDCGFNLKVRNGDVFVNEPVFDGEAQRRPQSQLAPQAHPQAHPQGQPQPQRLAGVRGYR